MTLVAFVRAAPSVKSYLTCGSAGEPIGVFGRGVWIPVVGVGECGRYLAQRQWILIQIWTGVALHLEYLDQSRFGKVRDRPDGSLEPRITVYVWVVQIQGP